MFSKAFSNPSKAHWIIQGAGAIWLLTSFVMLRYYGIDTLHAGVDAVVYTLAFHLIILSLDKIFSFYIPKGGNNWLLLVIPLMLGFTGAYFHKWILQLAFFENDLHYLQMLQVHFYLRWAILAMAGVFIALIAIIVARLERQEELSKREAMMSDLSKEAELTQLRQQLQPHFLFNSLNSINALVISQPKKAREMVLQLSDFLRGTIRKDLQKWVTLEEDLNYLRMYLEIERVRFGHRLEVVFEVSEEAAAMQLPQLLIQPLLENAIKHGLYGVIEDVRIELTAEREQNYLIVHIRNPYDPDLAAQKGAGFGLSSVHRRLFLIFGRKDLLDTQASASIFTVILKIPQLK